MKTITNREQQTIMALLAGLVLLLLIGISTPLAYAKAIVIHDTGQIPLGRFSFLDVPCAAGGAGERVHLTGQINIVSHITLDGAGGAHLKLHSNTQGVIGTGSTTGDKYQAIDIFELKANVKVGEEQTFVQHIRMIGPPNGVNFLLHVTFHITVHPDGTVTASVLNVNAECK